MAAGKLNSMKNICYGVCRDGQMHYSQFRSVRPAKSMGQARLNDWEKSGSFGRRASHLIWGQRKNTEIYFYSDPK